MGEQRVQQRRRVVRILHEDPELAHRLEAEEAAEAARQTLGLLEEVHPGPWRPRTVDQGKTLYGGLILSGLLVRELSVGTGTSAELLGAGDVILPRGADEAIAFVSSAPSWAALEPTRLAWLDAPFGVAMRRWPGIGAALLERSQRRFERVAVSAAVAQLTRVDERVLLQLWHLAERWGRMRADGVVLPLRFTHRVLARLIGARRPSVTTALGALEDKGELTRLDNGGWLLHGRPPLVLDDVAPPPPWQHGRSRTLALERVGMPER